MGPDGRVLFQNRLALATPAAPRSTRRRATSHWRWPSRAARARRSTPTIADCRSRICKVTRPTFATPQVLRTRTARSFAEVSANANAIPVASRTFSRTERLLVRVPAYGPADSTPVVTAHLLNRRGTPMRELQRVPADLLPSIVQFDLPLASLAPDEYRVELVAANAQGPRDEARETLTFRVTN